MRVGLAFLLLIVLLPAVAPRSVAAAAEEAVTVINAARARAGVAPLSVHPALTAAAVGHATYYRLNHGDPALAGMGLHQQTPGRPGFTGVETEDRVRTAGYTGVSVNEMVGLTGDLIVSLRWHIGTVNHRLPLLEPRYAHVGLASITEGAIRFDVIVVGAAAWPRAMSPDWVAWPPDGADDVGRSFQGETPNPFPGERYPLGYPLTLAYHGPGTLTVSGGRLTTGGGETVPVAAQQGTGWLSRRAALVAARAPLAPATDYVVEVSGQADGRPFTRQWRFRTGGAGPVGGAPPTATPTATLAPTSTAAPVPTATSPALPPAPVPTTSPTPVASPKEPPPPPPPVPAATAAMPAPPPAARVDGGDLPAGVKVADRAVAAVWQRSDGGAARTRRGGGWLWGPDVIATEREAYAEAAGGERGVYYFDKSRMEISDPAGDRGVAWFLTNGLLARELITGEVQVGHQARQVRPPAEIPVAGDGDDPSVPTYAAFGAHISRAPDDQRFEPRIGQPVTATLEGEGRLGQAPRLGQYAAIAAHDTAYGHNIPDVLWAWMNALDEPWLYVLGAPIAEPMWIRARVGGVERDVLVQVFERRVVTFTPDNGPEWQVEMGNVGRHYYQWRYARPIGP